MQRINCIRPTGKSRRGLLAVISLLLACQPLAYAASPFAAAGDSGLRHDIQLLADYGILRGPVSTWPLSWGPIADDLDRYDPSASYPDMVSAAVSRLQRRLSWETRTREVAFSAEAGVAEAASRIRGFERMPREKAEVGVGASWVGESIAAAVHAQVVEDTGGNVDVRLDGSLLAIALGNWSLSVNTLDRWWGPAWDGSLVLSNNARPIPAASLDRIFTDPFEHRFLSWLGSWDLSISMGLLEEARHVPNALWFGMRFNFKPSKSLEIGLSRTAQWCGDGRPCDAGTFADLLIGRDNRGDEGVDIENEPGNQMAGIDFRWSFAGLGIPGSLYGQLIGEDEAGGFPSRYIGQFGFDVTGQIDANWSYRAFAEGAGTTCQFYESSERFNCAYSHGIYQTGYRYKKRSIGHGIDGDSRVTSLGLSLININENQWRGLVRLGTINRGPGPDSRHTISPLPLDLFSIDISNRRVFEYGMIEIGAGYETTQLQDASRQDEFRFYLQWRSSY